MKGNGFLKVVVVLLVIVCVCQGCTMASMQSTIDALDSKVGSLNNAIENLNYRIEDLEGSGGMTSDFSYEMTEFDLESGVVKVKVSVYPVDVTADTRIYIGVENEKYELTKKGTSYEGILEYPMDSIAYETILYQYEGDYQKGYETLDWINVATIVSDKMCCKFDGYTAYGNGRLTLAGDFHYGFDTDITVKEARILSKDQVMDVESIKKGNISLNISEKIDEISEEGRICMVYLEVVSEDGVTYQIYPEIYAHVNNQVIHNIGEEEMEDVILMPDNSICQNMGVVVILPDGTTHEMWNYN